MSLMNEAVLEESALGWFAELGFHTLNASHSAPGEPTWSSPWRSGSGDRGIRCCARRWLRCTPSSAIWFARICERVLSACERAAVRVSHAWVAWAMAVRRASSRTFCVRCASCRACRTREYSAPPW